jgi:hypothetical protein
MRGLFAIVASVMLLATAAADAAEIDGFRGVPWGSELASLSSAEFGKLTPFKGIAPNMESYQRKNDSLKLEDAAVESISYNFSKGRLVSVNIDFNGFYNYESLLSFCKKQFGPVTASMAKNNEMVSSFESAKSGALLVFQAGTPQLSFGRLFLFSKDWLR